MDRLFHMENAPIKHGRKTAITVPHRSLNIRRPQEMHLASKCES